MLSEIGFTILAILSPILVLIAYRQGVKDRIQQDKEKPLQPFFNLPKGSPNPTEHDIKMQAILDNINAYDGTGKGQQEVR